MSRGAHPQDCECNLEDDTEALKCGPCKKCRKRASEMDSSLNYLRVPPDPSSETESILRKVHTRSKETDYSNTELWVPWTKGYTLRKLGKMQEEDSHIRPILEAVKRDVQPGSEEMEHESPVTRNYWANWKLLELKDGILFRKYMYTRKDGTGTFRQFIAPAKLHEEILDQMHNSVLSGHLGRKKTKEKTIQIFFWHEIREDIDVWISKCKICQQNKLPAKNPRAPLGTMRVGATLDRLATDILGPLPLTPRGNQYILVPTDHFTKWVEIMSIPDQTAQTCAEKLLNAVISRYGCPVTIHTDQGRNFESNLFKELCELLEVKKTRTSPRNPKCNGQVEIKLLFE
jgi:hypothetical protein